MDKKRGILQVVICISLVCLIWGGYFLSAKVIRHYNMREKIKEQVGSMDYDFLFDFEEIDMQNKKASISGWTYYNDMDSSKMYLVLQSTEGEECSVFKADSLECANARKIFDADGNYGFKVEFDKKEIEADKCYEILFLFLSEEWNDGSENDEIMRKFTTNCFLYDGQLYRYNPKQFETPKILNENIQDVLEQGQVCMYNSEMGVWGYLFNGELFCIVNAESVVSLEEALSVPMSFYTFSADLVPESRKERYLEKGYDNYEIYLKEEHCFEGVDSQYYVVSFELPEYPITYVRTGIYENREDRWLSRNVFPMDIRIE